MTTRRALWLVAAVVALIIATAPLVGDPGPNARLLDENPGLTACLAAAGDDIELVDLCRRSVDCLAGARTTRDVSRCTTVEATRSDLWAGLGPDPAR